MNVILEDRGIVRSANDLSILGHWFYCDGIKYYIPIKNN